MMGPESNPGIMKNSIEDLFSQLTEAKKDFDTSVYISYIEVYNEIIRDLQCAQDTALDLREDPGKGIEIAGSTIIEAQEKGDILSMLK